MRIIKQLTLNQNAYAAVANLVDQLNLRVSHNGLKQIESHVDYPSLSSISDTLKTWNVENLAINSSVEQLKEIPYPAIAHLSKNNGHFVVLKKLVEDKLEYIDPEVGLVTEPIKEFEQKWTGVTLLVEKNSKSGEDGYEIKRREEIFQQVSQVTAIVLSVILVLLPFFILPFKLLSIYILKIVGVFLASLLLQKQFGGKNSSVDAFCKMGGNSDCDSVINSAASKLFGVVHLSEIGFLYFLGGLLSIVFSIFSTPLFSLLFLFSILSIPFSFFTIYYQALVVKKWCPLCLAVMVVLWLEFAAHLIVGTGWSLNSSALAATFLGFSLPAIFWLSVRQRFLDSFKLPKLERSLNRFLKSESVFQKLLESQPPINVVPFQHDIHTGNIHARVNVLVVSNPHCTPCAHAHAIVEDLAERFEEKVNITFRFLVNPSDTKSESYQMLSHLFALQVDSPNTIVLNALSDWYLKGGKSHIKKWKDTYPISGNVDSNLVGKVISDQSSWGIREGINATPTIVINGRKLPEEFSPNDLRYHLRKLIEKEQ
jgi:uncharacterized membrane protein